MSLSYITHEKVRLRGHPHFNEQWLHDRICDDPTILGLGEVRVLDRERTLPGGGRLDLLLLDDESYLRYEVEIMLGPTDPSHIIRTLEYWDLERRRYPAYEHIAVLVAEDITARFLNVMSLLSGSIPLVAIQLDALKVEQHIVLNFVQVLDQRGLREDDTTEDGGGGQVDRAYWDQKVGNALMSVCDQTLAMINKVSSAPQEMNYLRHYIGLRSNGVVRNFVTFAPKPTKTIIHINFHNPNGEQWKERLEEAGINTRARSRRFRVTMTPDDFQEHAELIREIVEETVQLSEE